MELDAEILSILRKAYDEYGNLNVALVAYWIRVNGDAPIQVISKDLNISSNVVRRAKILVSKQDT